MTKTHVKQKRVPLRRQAILDAALSAFTELGYEATTLAIICNRSGASVGSVYHFFSGKAEIALELIQKAISEWTNESGETSTLAPTQPETAICASVRGLLLWGDRNYPLFRFLEEVRAKAGSSSEFSCFDALFQEGQRKAESLYNSWVEQKLVKDIPWAVAYAMMTGPAYHYLRTKPMERKIPNKDVDLLVTAAWNAVKAEEKRVNSPPES